MSPWESKPGGGRRWKPPTAEARAKAGLSPLSPTQTGYVAPKAAPTTPTAPRAPELQMGATGHAQSVYEKPAQAPAQDDAGVWNWIKDLYYKGITPPGGMDPRREAEITGEPMGGASMMELLGVGAIGSAPMLAAKALAVSGSAAVAKTGILLSPEREAFYARAGAGLPPTAKELAGTQLTPAEKILENSYLKYAWRTNPAAAMDKASTEAALKLGGKSAAIAGVYNTAVKVGATAVSTKSLTLTGKILATLGISGGAATLALAVLGSYPFAGFVGKEETVQTLGFGYKAAMEAGDLDLADAALDEMEEVLYGASTLGDKIPIANIANALQDFTSGAKVTLAAQRELVQRMRDGTDKWSLINKAQEESTARITADRIEQQRIANEATARLRLAAQKARDRRERKILLEEMALWEAHKIKILELEKQAMEEQAAFWLAYLKEKLNMQSEGGRSHLGFGLL